MAELSGVEVLQSEIEKSRDKLKGYNENIKKLTGRDPSAPGIRRFLSDGGDREDDSFGGRMGRGRGRLFGLARRSIMEDSGPPPFLRRGSNQDNGGPPAFRRGMMDEDGPPVKRRIVGGAFSRLGPMPGGPPRRRDREDSPDEEELPHKLSVQSSVVSASRETKNRKEIMQEQTKDKEGMQRNRRMFGLLMGTLNRFKTESKTMQPKDEQRKKIDKKLEDNAEREKKKFQQETKILIEEMHLEQSKISRLQQKMEMVQEHSEREDEMVKLKNFIVTKAKPKIFWMPRMMTPSLEARLKDSKKVVDGMLQEGRDRLECEIKELMERESRREERIKMRLREGLIEDEDGKDGEGEQEKEGSSEVTGEIADRLGQRKEGVEEDDEEEEEEQEEEELSSRNPRRRVVVEEPKEDSGKEEGTREESEREEEEETSGEPSQENVQKVSKKDDNSNREDSEDQAEQIPSKVDDDGEKKTREESGDNDDEDDNDDEKSRKGNSRQVELSNREEGDRRGRRRSEKDGDKGKAKKRGREESEDDDRDKRRSEDREKRRSEDKEKRRRDREGSGEKDRRRGDRDEVSKRLRKDSEKEKRHRDSRERDSRRSRRDTESGERSRKDDRREKNRRSSREEERKKRRHRGSREEEAGEVVVKEEEEEKREKRKRKVSEEEEEDSREVSHSTKKQRSEEEEDEGEVGSESNTAD